MTMMLAQPLQSMPTTGIDRPMGLLPTLPVRLHGWRVPRQSWPSGAYPAVWGPGRARAATTRMPARS